MNRHQRRGLATQKKIRKARSLAGRVDKLSEVVAIMLHDLVEKKVLEVEMRTPGGLIRPISPKEIPAFVHDVVTYEESSG